MHMLIKVNKKKTDDYFLISGPGGPLCRGVPLCIDVGLNILQQMKAIPGRPGWLYVFKMLTHFLQYFRIILVINVTVNVP